MTVRSIIMKAGADSSMSVQTPKLNAKANKRKNKLDIRQGTGYRLIKTKIIVG